MNREILFRAKRIGDGKWFEGYYCGGTENKTISPCIFEYLGGMKGYDYHNIILDTLGQYTGLKDIHGVKIFEGDIIEAHFDELFPDLATTLVVVWSDYGWFGRDMDGNVDSLEQKWVSDFFEIIGNIHDNPELLEVSDNG